MGFLASMVDPSKETKLTLDNIPVVRDYVSVFLKDLYRLPPDLEIMFSTELVPGTSPFSRAPYQHAPTELKELKI